MRPRPRAQRRFRFAPLGSERSRGQAVVELTLLLPILMLVLLGTIDLGRLFALAIEVQNAAREGASFGATRPTCASAASCADPGNMTYVAREELGGDTGLSVSVACSPSCTSSTATVDHTVTVTVSRRFSVMTPIIAEIVGASITPTASATAVIQ